MRKQERRKIELQEMYLENLSEGHQFFDFMPSFTCHFPRLLPPPSQVMYLMNGPYKDT